MRHENRATAPLPTARQRAAGLAAGPDIFDLAPGGRFGAEVHDRVGCSHKFPLKIKFGWSATCGDDVCHSPLDRGFRVFD